MITSEGFLQWGTFVLPCACRFDDDNTELSICTTDGSYDGKTPNVASSPRRLSGPLRVVALGGPTEDKFDACAHEWNYYLTVAESIRRQIESSPLLPWLHWAASPLAALLLWWWNFCVELAPRTLEEKDRPVAWFPAEWSVVWITAHTRIYANSSPFRAIFEVCLKDRAMQPVKATLTWPMRLNSTWLFLNF